MGDDYTNPPLTENFVLVTQTANPPPPSIHVVHCVCTRDDYWGGRTADVAAAFAPAPTVVSNWRRSSPPAIYGRRRSWLEDGGRGL